MDRVSQVVARVGYMWSVAVPGDEETEGGTEWLPDIGVDTLSI